MRKCDDCQAPTPFRALVMWEHEQVSILVCRQCYADNSLDAYLSDLHSSLRVARQPSARSNVRGGAGLGDPVGGQESPYTG